MGHRRRYFARGLLGLVLGDCLIGHYHRCLHYYLYLRINWINRAAVVAGNGCIVDAVAAAAIVVVAVGVAAAGAVAVDRDDAEMPRTTNYR